MNDIPASGVPTRVRYKVLVMALSMAGITYLDRICISVTAPDMMRDLGIDRAQMSLVFSAFTLAYAIFEIPTGWWGDRIGARRVLTRIVAWWSAFTALTGAAFSYSSLLVTRFLFGVGEAGAWPNTAIAFSRWFPVKERGTAQGLFFMGAHLAGGLTPLLVVALLHHFTWRALFPMLGSVGFVWAICWYWWFRDSPAEHPSVNAAERAHIESGRDVAAGHRLAGLPWTRLLANRSVVLLCLMYFTQTYGFYLYITWMPTYLQESRGFSSYRLGFLAGLPLILSAVADVFGGMTTDRLTKRFGLRIGRATVGGASLAAAGMFLIAGTFVANPIAAAVLISLASASSTFLLGATWAACIDIGGPRSGVVSAAMNSFAQVGGILSPIAVVPLVSHFSWSAPLYLTGALYLLGAACWAGIDPGRRL